jgi:hypothetical protein
MVETSAIDGVGECGRCQWQQGVVFNMETAMAQLDQTVSTR